VLPELLETAPERPEMTDDVWSYFVGLSNERTEGRITSGMMHDYQWSEGVTIELWQRKAIKRLDKVFLESKDKGSD
tara:strand:+ start:22432 stop:22659 length:228 start_codon:yes stop_codon:yes gene_type:complete